MIDRHALNEYRIKKIANCLSLHFFVSDILLPIDLNNLCVKELRRSVQFMQFVKLFVKHGVKLLIPEG